MQDLISIIENLESQALGGENSNLGAERAGALSLYLGEPLGNEVEGRSQVVSRDVHDVIEWIKPTVLKQFMSGDQVCSFTPRNFEDTEAAEQETEYVNTVILERNPGFSIIYNWLHDGLLQKNGYVKVYWEESEDVTEEPYRGVTDEELLMLAQNPEVEIVEHEAYNDGIGTAHNIRLRITKQLGKVKLVNLPPEEVLVDDNHREVSLLNANFVQHRRMVTISELREMGYEVDDDIGDYETDDSVEDRKSTRLNSSH